MTAEEQHADTLPPAPGPLAGVHVGSVMYRHARAGYVAYREQTGGLTFDGRPMPQWEELPVRITLAWAAAALAIVSQPKDTDHTEGASGT